MPDGRLMPIQDIRLSFDNGDACDLTIASHGDGYSVSMDYRPKRSAAFDPHSGPIMNNAKEAFDFVLKIVLGIANLCGGKISAVDNPCNAELLSAADQQAVLESHGVSAPIAVNGELNA